VKIPQKLEYPAINITLRTPGKRKKETTDNIIATRRFILPG